MSSPQSLVGIVDSKVMLSCEARGQCVKFINWTVGDGTVSSDSVYDILSELTGNGIRSTLTIKLKLSHGALQSFCTAGTTTYPDLQASNVATIHGVLSAKHIFSVLWSCSLSYLQFSVRSLVSLTRPTVFKDRPKNLLAVCLLLNQSQMLCCSLTL